MINNDLISRSALIAEYDRAHVSEPGQARKLIENSPTIDAVPVVRCKDCVYMIVKENGDRFCDAWESYNGCGGLGFCHHGERKENG